MKVFTRAEDVSFAGPICLAIGVFDGVHRGHQRVIQTAIEDARRREGLALVVTFDKHPASIVAPERAPRMISHLDQRLETISRLGADAALALEFTREFSELTGEAFIRNLTSALRGVAAIAVGDSFAFGHKRSGNVQLLKEYGAKLGFDVHAVEPVLLRSERVSSTRTRATIRAGDLPVVAELLGRDYSLKSIVSRGDQLGRKIGFPTANINIDGLERLPFGVYAGLAEIRGKRHPAVANLGSRPTVSGAAETRFEVHILDWSEEIYGEALEFHFQQFIRPEQRFESLAALSSQIAADAEQARRLIPIPRG